MRIRAFRPILPLAAAVLAACSPLTMQPVLSPPVGTEGAPASPDPSPDSPSTLRADATQGFGVPPSPDNDAPHVLALARAGMALHLGLPESAVEVLSQEAVTWPNPSLGCPKLGFMYAQFVVPGYVIRLSALGRTYEVHTDRRGRLLTCGAPGEGPTWEATPPAGPPDAGGFGPEPVNIPGLTEPSTPPACSQCD